MFQVDGVEGREGSCCVPLAGALFLKCAADLLCEVVTGSVVLHSFW